MRWAFVNRTVGETFPGNGLFSVVRKDHVRLPGGLLWSKSLGWAPWRIASNGAVTIGVGPPEEQDGRTYNNHVVKRTGGGEWEDFSVPDGAFSDVCYDNGTFYMCGDVGGLAVASSNDGGINWSTVRVATIDPGIFDPCRIAAGGGSIAATGTTSVNAPFGIYIKPQLYVKTDSWRDESSFTLPVPGAMISYRDICFANGKFVVVGRWSGPSDKGVIRTSADGGTTWTNVSVSDFFMESVTYGEFDGVGRFYAGGSESFTYPHVTGGSAVFSSVDGVTWDKIESVDSGRVLSSVRFAQGRLVGGGKGPVTASYDGVSWAYGPALGDETKWLEGELVYAPTPMDGWRIGKIGLG